MLLRLIEHIIPVRLPRLSLASPGLPLSVHHAFPKLLKISDLLSLNLVRYVTLVRSLTGVLLTPSVFKVLLKKNSMISHFAIGG
ncbi:hypothetical protein NPIL_415431 [Nephila pilipes]|uniref:Uncharacterized protein n=1 Tax=Nephila pilipes TaxID=299642 RepID=A0A8X6JJT9_NEPPI|nr:hypothetical protein NPIL_415431 [Nephila pilipes]